MAKIARVIAVLHLDGNEYHPNQVIEFDNGTAKALKDAGSIDTEPAAIAYCTDTLRVKMIRHAPTEDEAARLEKAAAQNLALAKVEADHLAAVETERLAKVEAERLAKADKAAAKA
ncbi:hypothetical protein AAKU55_003150 [Oxalobacteraceae bacterium GrIS 1.11]